jgi:hypothetical protein
MTHIVSVSVTEGDFLLIKERNLSPSAVLRDALERIKGQTNEGFFLNSSQFEQKITLLAQKIQTFATFLEEKGLVSEFERRSNDRRNHVLD